LRGGAEILQRGLEILDESRERGAARVAGAVGGVVLERFDDAIDLDDDPRGIVVLWLAV
jgi:hypothetical protein